jgi:hypothetical protein
MGLFAQTDIVCRPRKYILGEKDPDFSYNMDNFHILHLNEEQMKKRKEKLAYDWITYAEMGFLKVYDWAGVKIVVE